MSYSLESISAPGHRKPVLTVVGEAGSGKTTLASEFDRPIFLRTEDGLQSVVHKDVKAFPLARSSADVLEQISVLAKEKHDFDTLVIDSITQLNSIIEAEIVRRDPKANSINQANGGYGAGPSAAAAVHALIRERTDWLNRNKNMSIIFVAHADTETVEPPDADAYTRFTLRMHRKSAAHYIDNVDAVAFVKLQIFTAKDDDERSRVSTSGQRIITMHYTPNHISKNRYGIKKDLPFPIGSNPLKEFIPALRSQQPADQPDQAHQHSSEQHQPETEEQNEM